MANLHDELWTWAQKLPDWQADLARRLCETELVTDDDIEEVGTMLLAAHGALAPGMQAPAPRRITRNHLPTEAPPGRSARLKCISHVTGLGLVAPKQVLELGPELTVIYGGNGAGKSSYAKVLKNACRARQTDRVLANVFEPAAAGRLTDGAATFTIEVDGGAKETFQRRHDAPPDPRLRNIGVFDERCAEAYVKRAGAADDLVPPSLLLLTNLAEAQGRVKCWCTERRRAILVGRPRFDVAENVLVSIAERDDREAALEALFEGDPEVAHRKAELDRALALAEADGLAARNEARRIETLIAEIERFQEVAGRSLSDIAGRLRMARAALDRAEEDAQVMNEAAARLDLAKGTGGELWRGMWSAATRFACAHGGKDAVEEADRCPLCRQALGEDARDRFRLFASLADDAAQKVVVERQRAVAEALADLEATQIELGPILVEWLSEDERFRVETWIGERRAQVAAMKAGSEPSSFHDDVEVTSTLAAHLDALHEWRRLLLAAMDSTKYDDLAFELSELSARVEIQERPDDARAFVESTALLARIDEAEKATASNRITRLQKRLAAELFSPELEEAFQEELRALGITHLRVAPKTTTTKGCIHAEMELRGAAPKLRIDEVMSTGERCALGLAFFLAEVRMAAHGGGIILDDPVSSLDHERLDHVAGRLVAAAKRRQVIVFTHDIRLMLRLEQLASERGLDHHTVIVSRLGETAGIIGGRKQWVTRSPERRIRHLRQKLKELRALAKKNDVDAYEWSSTSFLAYLRRAWERAVEENLLNGAVQRFSPAIETRRLAPVRVTRELVEAVQRGMSACSSPLHDNPDQFRDRPPSPNDLETMLDEYQRFLDRCPKVREELRAAEQQGDE